MIGEYKPVRIDTASAKLENQLAFEKGPSGARLHRLALDSKGGMSAELIQIDASRSHTYRGNYLLTLKGECEIEGQGFGQGMLVVATTIPTAKLCRSLWQGRSVFRPRGVVQLKRTRLLAREANGGLTGFAIQPNTRVSRTGPVEHDHPAV